MFKFWSGIDFQKTKPNVNGGKHWLIKEGKTLQHQMNPEYVPIIVDRKPTEKHPNPDYPGQ